ncbi:unnamed protein product [Caenorhabditis angaria]|uniref:Uncharacterized protein n=1 Tax=Caenorhabditis angaria TaxID=860376 RepID=A0A9P1IAS0_9PELO|nr:unnamed protein product [Caenorhabditis angaria]
MNLDKTRFCSTYLSLKIVGDQKNCAMKIGKISNRCEALKSCCESASRCEQDAIFTETGRTLTGLKEEIAIKLAECAEKMTPKKSLSPRKILKSPPFSLCLNYLQCQKDAYNLKAHCFDPDFHYQKCAEKLGGEIRKMHEKREEAFEYLDKCVPIVNVTREFMITERVCRASALKIQNSPTNFVELQKSGQNCHFHVAQKRQECAILRDCCVQADVCERSALYAAISDEYLLRRTELRQELELCRNSDFLQ